MKITTPFRFRRTYQKEFCRWLNEKRSCFVLQPIATKKTVNYVSLRLKGIRPELTFKIAKESIVAEIIINKQESWQVFSIDIDTIEKTETGFLCRSFDMPKPEHFPDLTTMRQRLIFEPFLEWCNEVLMNKKWIRLAQSHCVKQGTLEATIDEPISSAFIELYHIDRALPATPLKHPDVIRVFHLPLFENSLTSWCTDE